MISPMIVPTRPLIALNTVSLKLLRKTISIVKFDTPIPLSLLDDDFVDDFYSQKEYPYIIVGNVCGNWFW